MPWLETLMATLSFASILLQPKHHITFDGATGPHADTINGAYTISTEEKNRKAVYVKEGDPSTRCHHEYSRWTVVTTAATEGGRGANNSQTDILRSRYTNLASPWSVAEGDWEEIDSSTSRSQWMAVKALTPQAFAAMASTQISIPACPGDMCIGVPCCTAVVSGESNTHPTPNCPFHPAPTQPSNAHRTLHTSPSGQRRERPPTGSTGSTAGQPRSRTGGRCTPRRATRPCAASTPRTNSGG